MTVQYNLVVTFTDSTGSLTSKVSTDVATALVSVTVSPLKNGSRNALGLNILSFFFLLSFFSFFFFVNQADDFTMLEMEDRTKLKVAKLFDFFKVYFKVDWAGVKDSRVTRITILECQQVAR